jgi:hypothetical protein
MSHKKARIEELNKEEECGRTWELGKGVQNDVTYRVSGVLS